MKKVCQYPVTGEVHFYGSDCGSHEFQSKKCQYPVTGEVHFYDKNGIVIDNVQTCVNTL